MTYNREHQYTEMRDFAVGSLTLQDIDVVQLEARQTGLDGIEDMLGMSEVNSYPGKTYQMCVTLRLRPRWLMIPISSGLGGTCVLGSFATAA